MKLTDYMAKYLADIGVKKVFLLTGGACAHIVDSLGKNPNIEYVCVQHEQAASMAADAYSRKTNNIGVAVATSGPGATNLITGVCCSYFDSVPALIITGQVNLWETKGYREVRQLGFQETDIIKIVRPITKFAVLVEDPRKIKYFLDKAIYIAKSGRQGPVWIDVPMNVQHAEINPDDLEVFDPSDPKELNLKLEIPKVISYNLIRDIVNRIHNAKRPVIIAGAGIKLSKAQNQLLRLLDIVKIPVVTSWSGIDNIPHNHPLYIGQIGVYGSRAANFTVQNSDLVLSIGSRLDTRQTGGQPKTFAREATKVVVDIDEAELKKNWVHADIPIHSDAYVFLTSLMQGLLVGSTKNFTEWLETCLKWKEKYPAVLPEYKNQKDSVNPYVFIDALSEKLPENSTVTVDNGGISVWAIQGLKVKKGQQIITAFGHAPMGYALAAAIGVASADNKSNVVCIIGDGGFQLTIQELQTIKKYGLPIKIFIVNNNSYGIIKQFQETYFDSRYEATVNDKGYSAPDFVKVAKAYGIPAIRITSHRELNKKLDEVLKIRGPIICDVRIRESQKLIPKLIAIRTKDGKYISKPIEDMSPLLPREEFRENMIVSPLIEEDGDKESKEIN